ncbi:type IV pilin [Halomicrococcus gelatinilyticus]|uniref:type IV pilin n=1 Tax=Halomicrococcus gelatinilyticus TaxID=1702103 RepID=UPI002E0E2004
MSSRALSPVVGTALLVVVTVVLAGTLGAVALESTSVRPPSHAAVTVSADADADRLTFVHRAGDSLPVDRLTVVVRVDGTPLAHQPPVPFFAATGFRSGPTGPFNSAANETWDAGERTSVRLAGTNAPLFEPGDSVAVRILLDGRLLVAVRTTAE